MEKTMKEMLTAILALSYEKARDEDYEACEGLEFYACRTEGLANILMFGRAFYLDATMPENPRNIARIKLIYRLSGLAERDAVAAYKQSLQSDLKSMTAIVSSVKKGEQPDYVHVSKLDELQARNTALMAALEKIKQEHGYRYTYGDGFGNVVEKRINSVGVMVNTALAANTEKGGVQE